MDKLISEALKTVGADYIEIRIEETNGTDITYVGKELERLAQVSSLGGCVRAMVKGGWGFVSFNKLEDLPRYAKRAVEQAAKVAREPMRLAPIPAIKSDSRIAMKIDPAGVPLGEKHDLISRYNSMILGTKGVATSSVRYRDRLTRLRMANSDGADIRAEIPFCGAFVAAIARDGMNVQQAYESVGRLEGFEIVQGMEESCGKVCKRALDLLKADPIEGGQYTVIVDPKLCGVFVHEAFGHLSEADFLSENPRMREIMRVGKRFGPDMLSIVDDGTVDREAGSDSCDAEGTLTRKTHLIRDGILTNHLHSRETAARMGEEPTGNARAISYSYPPIVRMTNTYMEPRGAKFEDIIAETEDGIYAIGALGGQTNTEMFTFSAEEAYRISGGKICELLREVVLTGNVFDTLMNIDAICDDIKLHGGLGGCGKGDQSPLRVGDGGPHCRIRNVVVGGHG
ncbi:MAG TPA: TldD/PmbA family protein [Candidatus Brocadiia bacterium]|nr:TldD/PmbA family protein [Candidatus Brocadiia bacterium]